MVQDTGLNDNHLNCCDVDFCQRCTVLIREDEGYFIDTNDIGKDADGRTAEVFRTDVERFGKSFIEFKQKDIGSWCDTCSWILQEQRST